MHFQSSIGSLLKIRAAMINGFCEHRFRVAGCTNNLFSFVWQFLVLCCVVCSGSSLSLTNFSVLFSCIVSFIAKDRLIYLQ
jgi:hypothetical protein